MRALQFAQRPGVGHTRLAARECACVGVFRVNAPKLAPHFVLQCGDAARIAEKVLGAQEHSLLRAAAERGAQAIYQRAHATKRLIVGRVGRAQRGQAHQHRQRLQQRTLARAVFAHQQRNV